MPNCNSENIVWYDDGIMKMAGVFRQRYKFLCKQCYDDKNLNCRFARTELGENKTKEDYRKYITECVLRDIEEAKKQARK